MTTRKAALTLQLPSAEALRLAVAGASLVVLLTAAPSLPPTLLAAARFFLWF